jgi:hypothetical protein
LRQKADFIHYIHRKGSAASVASLMRNGVLKKSSALKTPSSGTATFCTAATIPTKRKAGRKYYAPGH